uniref:hypothetical protein n=1 Tax=Pseudomonas viridiflava TaxID=33069 RepID=UPI00197D399F
TPFKPEETTLMVKPSLLDGLTGSGCAATGGLHDGVAEARWLGLKAVARVVTMGGYIFAIKYANQN